MTGQQRPGIAAVPDLIREAAVALGVAAGEAAIVGVTWVAVPLEVVDWLASWLFGAATREVDYRAAEPRWDPADEWEEAWVAGILAARWLGRDPADYDMTPPPRRRADMHIRLRLNPSGLRSLTVDGTEIASAIESVLVSHAGGQTHAIITLTSTIDLDCPVHVELPYETVHALKTLGWTPPPGPDTSGTPAVQEVPR